MKAKKVLSTALLLALSTAMLITPVSANEADDYGTVETIEISSQAVELKELKGSIKEIREMELVVEDADGKEYIVPIFGFKQLEEYQAADLQVGDEIELKGFGSQMMEGVFTATAALMEGETVLKLKKADGEIVPDIAINWGATDLKDNSIVVSTVSAAKAKELSKEEIEKLMQKANADSIELSRDESGISVRVFNGNIETAEALVNNNQDFVVSMLNPVEEIAGLSLENTMSLRAMPSGDLFIANEITVNGITLKLENMVAAKSAIKEIK